LRVCTRSVTVLLPRAGPRAARAPRPRPRGRAASAAQGGCGRGGPRDADVRGAAGLSVGVEAHPAPPYRSLSTDSSACRGSRPTSSAEREAARRLASRERQRDAPGAAAGGPRGGPARVRTRGPPTAPRHPASALLLLLLLQLLGLDESPVVGCAGARQWGWHRSPSGGPRALSAPGRSDAWATGSPSFSPTKPALWPTDGRPTAPWIWVRSAMRIAL